MTNLIIPTTLIATIPVFTYILISVTRQRPVYVVPPFSISPLGVASRWDAVQLDSRFKTPILKNSILDNPIRERLRWRSESMKSTPDPSPKITDMPPPPLPHPSRDSSLSQTNPRSMKRFSVPVPLHTGDNINDNLSSTATTSPESLVPPATPASARPATPEANDFLTALAAQERRVLELKEELEKAETDLTKLKKQWAIHEVTKKRNEIRHAEPLRPLKSPTKDASFPIQPSANKDAGGGKRLSIRTRQPQRRVFSGGRHTRTLSLLSPISLANRENLPVPISEHVDSKKSSDMPKTAMPRISTTPVSRNPQQQPQQQSQQQEGTKEDLVHTGRQLVGDLKDGLFNFFEDLRQATVGDEALTAGRSRHLEATLSTPLARRESKSKGQRTPNRASMALRKKSPTDLGPLAGALAGVSPITSPLAQNFTPRAKRIIVEDDSKTPEADITKAIAAATDSDDEGWSNWDSPAPVKDSASMSTSNSSNTALSTPRSSLSSDPMKDKRLSLNLDQIPWPALQKLSPSHLTRTASNLMSEWEKSLNDPLEERNLAEGRSAT